MLDVAEPILDSSDIRQALDQSKSDAETLRGLIRRHAADLICAKDNPDLSFVERLRTPAFVRHWRPILAASVVILVIIGLRSISLSLIVFLVLGLAFYAAWFINIVLYGIRDPLEPIAATKYVLERVVVGPFLREQIVSLRNSCDGGGALYGRWLRRAGRGAWFAGGDSVCCGP